MSVCRYGVFDEHGYPGDPLYPLFYYETVEDGDDFRYVLRTSFCTNQELDGHRMYVCAKKEEFSHNNFPIALFLRPNTVFHTDS